MIIEIRLLAIAAITSAVVYLLKGPRTKRRFEGLLTMICSLFIATGASVAWAISDGADWGPRLLRPLCGGVIAGLVAAGGTRAIKLLREFLGGFLYPGFTVRDDQGRELPPTPPRAATRRRQHGGVIERPAPTKPAPPLSDVKKDEKPNE